jgi:twitching motility two-component system response regulator PilG
MGKLVMIVDDSLTVRKILEVTLSRQEIDFVSYSDGIEVLRALHQEDHPIPDLVILDISLPKMNGYTLARLLRTRPQFDHTAIVMLSGRDGMIDYLKARLAGAKDYITKPFRTQDVVAVVQSHLRLIATTN